MWKVGVLWVLGTLSGVRAQENYTPAIGRKGTRCYDDFNRPQRCIPEFENAAFDVLMEATNTCGDNGPIEFCVQADITSLRKSCEMCYPGQHSARYLTDFHTQDNQTWWQSETMFEGIQYPSQVNLTLNLGKAFDITYVRLVFYSPRPESFAIYKRFSEDSPWIPYQFYSTKCRDMYGLPDSSHTNRGEETRALCTSEYSDISPLRGGNVAFSSLEGRPSAYSFDTSPELQEWVTATDLRISLDSLNTFGDQLFQDSQVLRSYFFAVADVAVGARCKCNGHASECITSSAADGTKRRVCKCEHNTAGPDCNECLPFYNDAPWGRASARNSHECKPCNCNGFSNRCYFDKELYERTGHGGHCLDCAANRDGPNCERCRENYYQREDHYCIACNCDPVGSRSLQCNSEGNCQCKPGVTGEKCDRCDINHYDFGSHGCKNCSCADAGSVNNQPNCDANSGTCYCKENVEGKRCRECKPGFFNLDVNNQFGCTPCFCYGHSSECKPASAYSKYQIESAFAKSNERWHAEDEYRRPVEIQYNGITQSIGVSARADEPVYFVAPDRYLGDQRASYNQLLYFSLRIGENTPVPTATDIILEGAGSHVTNTIFAQNNKIPAVHNQDYKFRLHEHTDFGWQPRLSARAFMSILTNLTAIRIRGTYTNQGVGFLDNVKLETASRGVAGLPALWVENCDCPQGYVGQFCESCAPGFRHSPSLGGPFMPCIPCDCNKHADICDSETGRCICQHHTSGDNCELCARGYYGNALGGTHFDCHPCGCPDGGACVQLDDAIVCTECPVGYTGHRCDICSDGYFGDPTGQFGPASPCQPCECNLNIDPNGIGNCNTTTGECLKCIHNTGGPRCNQCLPGYYGDALTLPKGDCKRCTCFSQGTEEGPDGSLTCDQISGSCHCKPQVMGKNCDECEDGYYNIMSGEGCQACNCNSVGSLNQTCDLYTGQCFCKPGITGLRCDRCEPYKYGFSSEGCKNCDCDRIGSKDFQCDASGQCHCRDNVEGRRCDRCKENKYDRQRGCVDCPHCYNLVQEAVHQHQAKLIKLNDILDEIERNPTVIDDDAFEKQLKDLQEQIRKLYEDAKVATGGDDKTILQKLDEVNERQKEIARTLQEIDENIYQSHDKGDTAQDSVSSAAETLKEAEEELNRALDILQIHGKDALEKAKQRAKEFGQQSDKMTNIAHEARQLADDLDKQAETLTQVAQEAKNKSNQAYELAKNTTEKQKNVTFEIRQLRNDIINTENKLNGIKEWTEDVHVRAKDARNEALTLLNEVTNLVLPNVDVPKLKQRADAIKVHAEEVKNKTDDLINKNNNLLNEITELQIRGDDLLNRGTEQQDELNDLLNEIDFHKAQAENAVELGDKTLKEAQATYQTLSDFDQQVRESKEAAHQALTQIPEIENTIAETIDATNDADQSLAGAKDTANDALRIAQEADELAKNVQQKAQAIHTEAENLNKNTTSLQEEAELMTGRVENTETEYKTLLAQTQKNESLINQAKDTVGRAETETKEASKKVQEIVADVQTIVAELQGLPDLNEEMLDKLEEDLRRAEQTVKDANLDKILENLQKQQKEQNTLVDTYSSEIARLQKEVENVENIANALPDGCFKKVTLEP